MRAPPLWLMLMYINYLEKALALSQHFTGYCPLLLTHTEHTRKDAIQKFNIEPGSKNEKFTP